jgi:hypothetical protein
MVQKCEERRLFWTDIVKIHFCFCLINMVLQK